MRSKSISTSYISAEQIVNFAFQCYKMFLRETCTQQCDPRIATCECKDVYMQLVSLLS